MWIDWNEDGDFNDKSEKVFAASVSIKNKTKFWVTIPACTSPGKKRIRVALLDDKSAKPCGTYQYGEAEDYTLNVVAGSRHVADKIANDSDADVAAISINIYPNPASNYITIKRLGQTKIDGSNDPAEITLVDVNGKMIKQFKLNEPVQLINVSDIANGVYFIKIIGHKDVTAARIIIQH